jgi:hypothetical protein
MSTPALHHAAPRREPVTLLELAFGLAGGPLAWFLQFNAGYALASWPCFPQDHRMQLPMDGYAWSLPTMVMIMICGVLIALAALWVSWRNLQKSPTEGRSRFLALWGVMLGGGFALASLVTGVAFALLPRCAG